MMTVVLSRTGALRGEATLAMAGQRRLVLGVVLMSLISILL